MSPDPSPDQKRLAEDLERVILPLAIALSAEVDLPRLLERIVVEAKKLCHADSGTLYLRTRDDRLEFAIVQADSLGLALGGTTGRPVPFEPLPLRLPDGGPNLASIAARAALERRAVHVPDVYAAEGFDFSGTRRFDREHGYRSVSCLTVPLRNHEGRAIGVIQLVNARDASGTTAGFDDYAQNVTEILASQAAIALNSRLLREEQMRLTEQLMEQGVELAARHEELQAAYLRAETANQELASALKSARFVRGVASVSIFLLFLALGFFVWGRLPSGASPSGSGTGPSRDVSLEPREISSVLLASGSLQPLGLVTLVAPFDSKVAETYFEYGQRVEPGDLLLKIDTSSLEVERRNAEATWIRARQRLAQLAQWEQGSEVAQARRSVSRAQLALDKLRKEVADEERLLSKGIVSAAEVESARQQLQGQEMDAQSAEEQLRSTLAEGGPEARRIAEYELENAATRLKELEQRLGRAEVHAAVAGVLFPPEVSGGRRLSRGSPVAQGEAMLAIGNIEGLSVSTSVNQLDVARVAPGQRVWVAGDAFGGERLEGQVASVSSEGKLKDGVPYFGVAVAVDNISEAQRKVFRLGMNADLEIVVYERPDALVAPVDALRESGGRTLLSVVDPASGRVKEVEVRTGVTTLDGVEILSGLAPGAVVRVAGAED